MVETKILIVGDSIATTSGLAYVAINFLHALYTSGYEVAYCVVSGQEFKKDSPLGKKFDYVGDKEQCPVYYAPLLDKNKAQDFDDIIKTYRPTIVISFLDPWMLDQVAYCYYRNSYYWIAYLTLETPKYPEVISFPTVIVSSSRKSIKDILLNADLCIPCTKMGYQTLKNLFKDDFDAEKVSDNIYCGIDNVFIEGDQITKKRIFGVEEDVFIFMTVGLNGERKRIDKVVEAYYEFLMKQENKDKFKLYIHSDLDKNQGGTDLKGMIKELGIMNNVLIPSGYKSNVGVTKENLYAKYSCCDCYIGLSGGEGFGYGYAEALLFKKPIIYINYGGHVEYCKDFGLPVSVDSFYNAQNAYIQFALADIKETVEKMKKVVYEYAYCQRLAIKGNKFVIDNMEWSVVSSKFVDIVKKTESFLKLKNVNNIYKFMLKRMI